MIKLSGRAKNRTGERHGRLICIEPVGKSKCNSIIWRCLCDCGKYKNIRVSDFVHGKTRSCGCLNRENYTKHKDLGGKKFNMLTVIKLHQKIKYKSGGTAIIWKCLCDCGNITYKDSTHLVGGTIKSCGCLRTETTRKKCMGLFGNDHPAWTGNNVDKRTSVAYAEWRNSVFKKNDFECVICGAGGSELNAHHLDGYNWCNKKRMSIDNGITLCKDCHLLFHRKYGKGKNTFEQFAAFIENDI